uniref:NADH dehydrogenase subunit 6 n=1 Tax=Argopecten irradians TaxID=31199 RepID=A7LIB8_ARGIR|nr:NADH dehydrogenase subunit 6 [Argopecten irradians]ABS17673.1 NADH dehydrogenase subunit 6 [Argopecten irradians]
MGGVWFLKSGVVKTLIFGAPPLVNPPTLGTAGFLLVFLSGPNFGYRGPVWVKPLFFLAFLGGMKIVFLKAVSRAPRPFFKGVLGQIKTPPQIFGAAFFFFFFLCFYEGWFSAGSVLLGGLIESSSLSGGEMVDSSWVSSLSFVFLALVLAICMVSVTKLCSYNSGGSLRGMRSKMD